MRYIRAAVFYLVACLATLVCAGGCVLTWPVLPRKTRYLFGKCYGRILIETLRVVCGVRYEVRGAENVPADAARLVVLSKHQSAWETLFMPAFLPRPMSFVYKQSLHWIPLLGWSLKSLNMVAVNRNKGVSAYANFLKKGRDAVERGWWIMLFPEGTRVAPGKRVPYKSGGARFAVACNCDVLPVALNSGHCWGRNQFAKTPGTITVSFGPVIRAEGKSAKELNEEVENWIEQELARIERHEAERADAGK